MDRIFYDNQEYAKYSDKFLKRFNLADQAAYDALPAATKNDDSKVFFIPDPPEHDYLYKWDFTKSLTDEIEGITSRLYRATFIEGTGVVIDSSKEYLSFYDNHSLAYVGRTIEIDIALTNKKFTGNGRFLMCSYNSGFIYRDATSQWEVYYNDSWRPYTVTNSDPNIFNGKTVKAIFTEGRLKVYSDNLLVYDGYGWCSSSSISSVAYMGSHDGSTFYNMTITGCRVYENEEEE